MRPVLTLLCYSGKIVVYPKKLIQLLEKDEQNLKRDVI